MVMATVEILERPIKFAGLYSTITQISTSVTADLLQKWLFLLLGVIFIEPLVKLNCA